MSRDLSKTLSFLVLHLLVGFTVAYAVTGSIAMAGGIALIEPSVNAVVFFFHEKIWNRQSGENPRILDLLLHRHATNRADYNLSSGLPER
ncbi:DUF2061 domain-containing protein [Altererythrobacter sp. SALINAS58]|uniref:DUF2061 domain-containing protein n=1 Tax=Alteripontixanthobacter muriae TaxID=2705546 RepID=UPI001575D510|nr:DUF2061 domain-containing protein [Alteripontixanthobacter muriae]NTZ43630.1 DUF2061 domain-containing protein [Alteripontixanthobacter muriae]